MPQLQEPDIQTPQICLARALYDNVAEAPDELSFCQGDILTVLEQNTNALEGWWLCALRGRQGIAPGNRLRLLAGMYDAGCDINTLQRQGKRRSWHVQPNKVLTPQKFGDVYLYDMPGNQSCSGQEQYDVPPATHVGIVDAPSSDNLSTRNSETYSRPNSCSSVSDSYDMPRPLLAPNLHQKHRSNRSSAQDDSYDIPQPSNSSPFQTTQFSCSSNSSVSSPISSMNDSISNNSNQSGLIPEYDVPKGRSVGAQRQLHQLIAEQNYDVPSAPAQFRELPLELNSALERLAKLEAETTSAISKLLRFAGPQWREKEKLEPKLMEVKFFVLSLQTSLHDLTEFGEGALGNAMNNFDNNFANKLLPMVRALKNADFIIQNACRNLESHDWSIDRLIEGNINTMSSRTRYGGFDALDQIVNCAKDLTEDVRQVASFIQGNSSLLFKKGDKKGFGDYDYVNLDKNHSKECLDTLPIQLHYSLSSLQCAESMVASNSDEALRRDCLNSDKQLLSFYVAQAETRASLLTHAIDAFLQTVEHNQPPKVFLAYGKFVIVSAHRLVHIGDTVHHNLTDPSLKSKMLNSADSLCKCLAATVQKTKKAAMQFPSVSAVQEMVDSMVDVSHLARDLKMCLQVGSQQ